MSKPKKQKRKGYTLLEMLIVVLIIAILTGIAYALYTRSITRSRATEAVNLIEIVRAKQMQEFARTQSMTGTGAFFETFPAMFAKSEAGHDRLTTNAGNETAAGPTTIVVRRDFTVTMEEPDIVTVEYSRRGISFTFCARYHEYGFGCDGNICAGFANVHGSVEEVCHGAGGTGPGGPGLEELCMNGDIMPCVGGIQTCVNGKWGPCVLTLGDECNGGESTTYGCPSLMQRWCVEGNPNKWAPVYTCSCIPQTCSNGQNMSTCLCNASSSEDQCASGDTTGSGCTSPKVKVCVLGTPNIWSSECTCVPKVCPYGQDPTTCECSPAPTDECISGQTTEDGCPSPKVRGCVLGTPNTWAPTSECACVYQPCANGQNQTTCECNSDLEDECKSGQSTTVGCPSPKIRWCVLGNPNTWADPSTCECGKVLACPLGQGIDPNTCKCGLACDPDEEKACYEKEGKWDSSTCTCDIPCNPDDEKKCDEQGGSWDSKTCTCEVGCAPLSCPNGQDPTSCQCHECTSGQTTGTGCTSPKVRECVLGNPNTWAATSTCACAPQTCPNGQDMTSCQCHECASGQTTGTGCTAPKVRACVLGNPNAWAATSTCACAPQTCANGQDATSCECHECTSGQTSTIGCSSPKVRDCVLGSPNIWGAACACIPQSCTYGQDTTTSCQCHGCTLGTTTTSGCSLLMQKACVAGNPNTWGSCACIPQSCPYGQNMATCQCESGPGCDPDEEKECVNNGGSWDDVNCVCSLGGDCCDFIACIKGEHCDSKICGCVSDGIIIGTPCIGKVCRSPLVLNPITCLCE